MAKKPQKLSNRRLHESEHKFRSIAEFSPNMIFIHNFKKIVYANKGCEDVMGYERSELYSPDFDFLTLITSESRDKVRANFREHLNTREVAPYEYKLITKDRKIIDAIITTRLIAYEGKKAILGIVTDISDRKKAEAELIKSEEKFRTVFQTSPDAINITRLEDGVFVDVNDGFTHLTGYNRRDIIGKSSLTIPIWKSPKERERFIKAMKTEGEVNGFETEFRIKDGTSITGSLSAKIIMLNERPHILSVGRDITELKDRLRYHRALFEISSEMIASPSIEGFLKYCVKTLGEITKVSRVYIFQNNQKNTMMSNTHEWTKKGIESFKKRLQRVPYSEFPYWKKTLQADKVIHATHITKDLPKEVHTILAMQKIKSILVVPIFIGKRFHGFLGFDECEKEEAWKESDIYLLRTVAQTIGNAISRDMGKRLRIGLQSQILTTKKLLQNVIDSAQDAVLATDLQGNITLWNRCLEQLSGFKESDVLGKTPYDLKGLEFERTFVRSVHERLLRTCKSQSFEMTFHRPGKTLIMSFTLAPIKDEKGSPIGIVGIGRDVTPAHHIHKHAAPGNSYLISSQTASPSLDILKGLMDIRKQCLCITRTHPSQMPPALAAHCEVAWMDSKDKQDFFSRIEKRIKGFASENSKAVILIERTDYIIGMFGFEAFLHFIYRVNSIIVSSDAILLVSVIPSILNEEQRHYLEQELRQLTVDEAPTKGLTNQLLEIMRFVNEKETAGASVSLSDVSQRFRITRPTATDRIQKLLDCQYLSSEKIGRNRIIFMTSEGKRFLSNLNI